MTSAKIRLYRNCYQLLIELSGRKGICRVWARGRRFPPSLPGDRFLELGSKSPPGKSRIPNLGEHRSVRRLAPRPEVLLLWYFVGACAATLKLKFLPYSWRKYKHRVDQIQQAADVIYWGVLLQQMDKRFSLLLRSCLRCREEVGNTFIVGKTMH